MKHCLTFIILILTAVLSFGQSSLVNIKAGSWKNVQSWLFQRIPSDTDDVLLVRDIVVDTNASCRSLTSNGYKITVAEGFHLAITGKDSVAPVDNDTLVSAVTIIYQGGGSVGHTANTGYKSYEYDSLKRVSTIWENPGDSSKIKITRYFYLGNSDVPFKAFFYNPCDLNRGSICYPRYDTTFYTYNNDGVVIKEVSKSRYSEYQLNYERTNDYDIQADSVFKYADYNSFVVTVLNENQDLEITENYKSDTIRFYRVVDNGNIVQQFDTSSSRSDRYVRKYDTNKNPLYKTSIHFPILPMQMLLFQDPEQKNNLLLTEERFKTNVATFLARFRKLYKYKSNGYPSEVFLPNYDGPNTLVVLKFDYTK